MNTNKTVLSISLCTALAMAASLQMARADDGNRGQLSEKDFKFACEAAQGGMMEVSLGQLAATKGSDQSVKDFGQRMVQDHSKANQDLTQLITQKGAALPSDDGKKTDKMKDHLNGLSGHDFDKDYIKDMVADHKKDIKLFQKEAADGEDADLKNFASKTLPTLQEHLQMAQTAEAKVESEK